MELFLLVQQSKKKDFKERKVDLIVCLFFVFTAALTAPTRRAIEKPPDPDNVSLMHFPRRKFAFVDGWKRAEQRKKKKKTKKVRKMFFSNSLLFFFLHLTEQGEEDPDE